MSPFRQWLREAPRDQHQLTLVAAIAVLALLGWSVLPAESGAESTGLASNPNVYAGSGNAGQPSTSSTPGTAGRPGSRKGPGGTAQGVSSAGPRAGTGPGPSRRSTHPGNPGITPAAGGTPCPALTASAEGITPTTVTVGITYVNSTIAEQFGIRTDTDDVVRAFVDDINQHGGVACRKLAYRLYEVNPFEDNSQRVLCESVAQDHMFALLDIGFLTSLATQSCVTKTHGIPLIEGTAWPASWVKAQAPLYLSPNTDSNRAARNWVFGANRAGFFDPSKGFKKLGLLYCADDGGLTEEIKRDLAIVKVTSITEFSLKCQASLTAAPSEVAQAEKEFELAGVSHVFPATWSTNVQVFLEAAERQLVRFRYSASDAYALTAPSLTEDFNANQWNGTIGYTSSRSGELRNGHPSPQAVHCDAVLRAHGVPGITSEWDDFPRAYCDLLHLLSAGLNQAPANPTRLAFSRAVQTAGRLGFSGASDGIYDRLGKVTGADFVRTIQWRSDDTAACNKGDTRPSNHQSTGCWFVLDPVFRPSS